MLAGQRGRKHVSTSEHSISRKQGGAGRKLAHSFIEFLDNHRNKWLCLWPGKKKNICILNLLFLKLLYWRLDSDRLHRQSNFGRNGGICGSDRLRDGRLMWQVWGSECFSDLVFLVWGECNQETENHYCFTRDMPSSDRFKLRRGPFAKARSKAFSLGLDRL